MTLSNAQTVGGVGDESPEVYAGGAEAVLCWGWASSQDKRLQDYGLARSPRCTRRVSVGSMSREPVLSLSC